MSQFIILGTSHIAQESVNKIKSTIEIAKPAVVAVELDAMRLHALIHNPKSRISISAITKIGVKGFLFALLGSYIQKKLGKIVGLTPGSDMLTAVKVAHKNNIPVALIDRNIEITLKRFSQTLTWAERFRFLGDIVKGLFFPKSQLKKYGNINLKTVPSKELIKMLTTELKTRYPNVYKVLIAERNKYMINQLKALSKKYPETTILAVVGAGHQEEIENGLQI